MSLKLTITQAIGKGILSAKTNSPVLLFGVGIAGFVGTTILATRSTLKLDEEVLEPAGEDIKRIKEATVKKDGTPYTDKERKHDLTKVYIRSALKTTKLYLPAVATGILSITCLTGSHVILTRRNASLTAAYATVSEAFKKYRERVVAELGVDKDREFRHGTVERQVAVDTDTGVDVKTIKTYDPDGLSGYARVFEQGNPNWQSVPSQNYLFLKMHQQWAQDRLEANGYLFLCDVYKDLGFKDDKASRVVGWVLGEGDDKVDFGVFNLDSPASRDFMNGEDGAILLDFNCSGNILDKIPSDC
jgi:hypothetical protein